MFHVNENERSITSSHHSAQILSRVSSMAVRHALSRSGHLLRKGYQAAIESALRPAVKQTFVGIVTPWFGAAINDAYLTTSIVNRVKVTVPQLRSH